MDFGGGFRSSNGSSVLGGARRDLLGDPSASLGRRIGNGSIGSGGLTLSNGSSRSTLTHESSASFESLVDEPRDHIQQHLLDISNNEFTRFLRNKELMQRGLLQSIVDEVYMKESKMIDQIKEHVMDTQAQLLSQYARASKRQVVDELVDATFAKNTMHGLVDWIPDDEAHTKAARLLADMQFALENKNGNDLRTNFDFLLSLYMEILHVRPVLEDLYQGGPLGNRISSDMRNYLMAIQRFKIDSSGSGSNSSSPTSVSGLNGANMRGPNATLDTDAQRLLGACFSILNIGNWASHNTGDLSYFKIVEVCGAIGALSETLPPIYNAYKSLEIEKQEKIAQEQAAAMEREHERQRREHEAAATANRPISAIARWGAAHNQPQPTSGAVFPPLPPPGLDIGRPSFAGIVSTKPAPPPEPKPVYKFFYGRMDDIPNPEQSARTQFSRMLMHMRFVDKANLCRSGKRCSDSNCKMSHTYMEVMTYNPLFKRIRCVQRDHYYLRDVREIENCACIHVDTGVSWEWMDTEKKKICEYMERCSSSRCMMSHSAAEICWYNPYFRTKECRFTQNCLQTKCLGYHNQQEKRDLFRDEDFVGVEHKMLFPERTHQELAKLLQKLEDSL